MTGWSDRLAWSGETPLGGDLNPVALQRFDSSAVGADKTQVTLPDAVDPSRGWTGVNFNASTVGLPLQGQWGRQLTCNRGNLNTEKTSLRLPFFPGLWPAAGKVLVALWAAPRYSANAAGTFVPLITTRNDPARAPLFHLSTNTSARPRHQLFDAAGTEIPAASGAISGWEDFPTTWTGAIGQWRWWCQLVDLDAKTSQMASVRLAAHDAWIGPVRTYAGQPNRNCTADLDVLYLNSGGEFWANGEFDEILVAHPGPAFNLADLAERLRRGTWAQGANSTLVGPRLTVTDQGVAANAAETLQTGAAPAAWSRPPTVAAPGVTGAPTAFLSTDAGASWSAATSPPDLPAGFDGLARWAVPLAAGETFTGVALAEPLPVPVARDDRAETAVDTPVAIDLLANDAWTGQARVAIVAWPSLGTVVWDGAAAVYTPRPSSSGADGFRYRLTDDTGQSAEASVAVDVATPTWDPPAAPVDAFQPPVVLDAAGEPAHVLADVLSCRVREEVNGDSTCAIVVHAAGPDARRITDNCRCLVAGKIYALRLLDDDNDGDRATLTATGYDGWYDLARHPRLPAAQWNDTQPGPVIAAALEGTGWHVGTVNKTTRRTWQQAAGNPLEVLRQVAKTHGGDLVMDSAAKTVSLLVTQGADRGVVYHAGRNLVSHKRRRDTTQLVTRLHAADEDGQTFARINGGLDYVEDHSFTEEIWDGHIQFKAGTNPYTMLALAQASLGKYSRPQTSYEAVVADLSFLDGHQVEAPALGDEVTIFDDTLGVDVTHKVMVLDRDLMEPENTKITLNSKLRELGDADAADAAVMTTGAAIDTRDLSPFNELLNASFDNGPAHWAVSGWRLADGGATGPNSMRAAGPGRRTLAQTVAVRGFRDWTLSMQVKTSGLPAGQAPALQATATFTFADGSAEQLTQNLV